MPGSNHDSPRNATEPVPPMFDPWKEAVSDAMDVAAKLRKGAVAIYAAVDEVTAADISALFSKAANTIEALVKPQWQDRLARFRDAGWNVAVHNDYWQHGMRSTFWLFTHPNGRWVRGEGATDDEALDEAWSRVPP